MKVLNFDDDDDDDDDERKNRKNLSLSQTIDQVMTIKTHTESSKTELSSRGKRPFKVWRSKSDGRPSDVRRRFRKLVPVPSAMQKNKIDTAIGTPLRFLRSAHPASGQAI